MTAITQSDLADLSIIIPLAGNETEQHQLLADLGAIRWLRAEILLSPAAISATASATIPKTASTALPTKTPNSNRGADLNASATMAQGRWLWFLHADSRVTADNLCALAVSLKQYPDALHYFDLSFIEDIYLRRRLRINGLGANLRSRLLSLPFGDQGLCISREQFLRLGGFPENCAYGDDLLFVWRAHQAGIPLRRIASRLLTSGRKYRQRGWLRLTMLYQWRWLRLCVPQYYRLLLQHWRQSR